MVQKRLLRTTRTSNLSEVEVGAKILELTAEDKSSAWGYRQIKERLAAEGYHVKR